ncbi:MAG: pyridoxamine 5'-phosphate oxidase family protein [Candidatus Binatia bacterium]
MTQLDKPRLDAFLQDTSIVAILASVDGRKKPYQVPVWYEWDGTYMWIVSKPRARYVRHIEKDPNVSVCIATPKLPYVRVLIQGRAKLIPTDQDWVPMGQRMAKRYLGAREGYAYIEKTKDWKRIYIRIKPTRIISWDGGTTGHAWGKKYIQKAAS